MQSLGFYASMSFQKSSARVPVLAFTEVICPLGVYPSLTLDPGAESA